MPTVHGEEEKEKKKKKKKKEKERPRNRKEIRREHIKVSGSAAESGRPGRVSIDFGGETRCY